MRSISLTLLLSLLLSLPVFAGTGPQDIANTPHNLTASNPDFLIAITYGATNEDEICVFCHTPHGGALNGPLWNRDVSSISGAAQYTHYTSATLSSAVGAANRAVNDESLLCLSCHDGSIGVGDSLLNTGGVTPDNTAVKVQPGFSGPGPRIGGSIADTNDTVDLSDDHPISFSYSAVLADKPGTLRSVSHVEDTGMVLFGGSETVECSTCHDPHVSYITAYGGDADYDPFLSIPNSGSDMCLSCHIK